MLTPQDIQNKEFTKAVFGGYDMTIVDDFLEDVAEDYANLYKENSVLKSKIKVLVEKVEEYRSTEDSMRMALMTAQKMGDNLLAEAKQKSSDLLTTAEKQADEKMKTIDASVRSEEARLSKAKEATNEFVHESQTIIQKYAAFLAKLPSYEVTPAPSAAPAEPPRRPAVPAPEKTEQEIVDTAKEIDENVSKAVGGSGTVKDDPDEQTRLFRIKNSDSKWSDEDEPTSPRPKFDFDDLKFGTNYDKE